MSLEAKKKEKETTQFSEKNTHANTHINTKLAPSLLDIKVCSVYFAKFTSLIIPR